MYYVQYFIFIVSRILRYSFKFLIYFLIGGTLFIIVLALALGIFTAI